MQPTTRRLEPGEILFLAGMGGEEAYLVRRGEIAIYVTRDGQDVELGRAGPGKIVGEMALLDGRPRSAAARAITSTEVMVLPRRLVERELGHTPPIIRSMIEGYLHTIRQSNRNPNR